MPVLTLTFAPASLGKQTNVCVTLPGGLEKGKKYPVLYLLHGLSDNESCWLRYTCIERYAGNVIVVMPNADRSFYTDIPNVGNYFKYITEDLPNYIEAILPVSDKAEDRYIAGLSMGGYGALKAAFTYPERYNSVAAFSAVADIRDFCKNFPHIKASVFDFVENMEDHDLFSLAKKCNDAPKKPKIYHWCGTEDFMYDRNVEFSKLMKSLDYDYTYSETSGGHEWPKWDREIQNALEFFGF